MGRGRSLGMVLIGIGLGLVASALLVSGLSAMPALPPPEPLAQVISITTLWEVVPPDVNLQPVLAVSPPLIVVEVPHGLTATEIAKLMVDSGVLTDEQEFIHLTVELGVDRHLRAGLYCLSGPLTSYRIVSLMSGAAPFVQPAECTPP